MVEQSVRASLFARKG